MLAILILLFSLHLVTFDSTAATYGPVASPDSSKPLHHHHRRHDHNLPHRTRTHAVSPSPSSVPGCGQICLEPLTQSPIHTPCVCVYPMKVRLLLQVSVYAVLAFVNELEMEIATGTYLKQSQVVITGASADSENEFRTVVDVNLVPFGDRFDNLTAALTYQKFWRKKLFLNRTLFGDYEVVHIIYPGLPISPNHPNVGPGGSSRTHEFPVTSNFIHRSQKINRITIFVIALSAAVLLIVFFTAISVIMKYKRICSSSNAVDPAFTSSTNKICGLGALFASDPTCSTAVSIVSTTPTSIRSVKTFALSEIEKATEKFSSKRVLGEGGFGCVYHGIMEDGEEVAVKLLNKDNTQNGDHEFIAEVEMLSRLHHRNLVKLVGICFEKNTRCLVYELVPNGSIKSRLHGVDNDKGPLDWDARLKIALGAARGLAYLHEDSHSHVIHRDFKASNVLLEDDFTPKVSDFGLAREDTEGSDHISTRVMGTFGYVAPEYAMTGHLLVKSDVYSYGVVLLELLSGRKPVDMSQPPGEENLVTWARPLLTTEEGLHKLADPTLAGTYDFNDMAKVAAIASMCVHPEVDRRPFMGEVVQALKLVYTNNDKDDTTTHRDSSAMESDFKGDGNWWNTRDSLPSIFGNAFMTMVYSSSFNGFEGESLTLGLVNRSGPLRTVRNRLEFYRLKGSMSEHGGVGRIAPF